MKSFSLQKTLKNSFSQWFGPEEPEPFRQTVSALVPPQRNVQIVRQVAAPTEGGSPAGNSAPAVRSKYFAAGYELARATKVHKPDPSMIKMLEEQAGADILPDPLFQFDPMNDTGDQRKFRKLEALDAHVEEAIEHSEIADAELRKREDELANCGGLPARPAASPMFRWTVVTAMTISIAPTIYGFFSGLFPLMKWLLAVGFAGAIALMIVIAIVPEEPPDETAQTAKEEPR